jgi:putative addiction module killer protein
MSPIDDNNARSLSYTDAFLDWRKRLKDRRAAARIGARLERLEEGHWGDAKPLGSVIELRLHFGPGYRIYVARRGHRLVVLLCGGDKSSQARDIALAQRMAEEIDDAP